MDNTQRPTEVSKLESRRAEVLLEDVIGCRWMISVLRAVAGGVRRPSALKRHIEGISAKVLNDRLQHLTQAGIFKRVHYPEIPPRVEYHFTSFGKKFRLVLKAFEQLQKELDRDTSLRIRPSKSRPVKLPRLLPLSNNVSLNSRIN
jgi:DNA-binding HxlR family transcriptional regulator